LEVFESGLGEGGLRNINCIKADVTTLGKEAFDGILVAQALARAPLHSARRYRD
jgi:hypothetical protein